jgi:arabinan endo-1,5-alpha-L-arabinosidase
VLHQIESKTHYIGMQHASRKRLLFSTALFGVLALLFYVSRTYGARIHDPSTIVRCNGEYWFFTTGRGVPSWRSRDLITWRPGPPVFSTYPSWTADIAAGRNGYYWAPDIIALKDRYLLYYAISRWGTQTSAIALATNSTLDPSSPAYHWTDDGLVIRTTAHDDYNAIDPSVMIDTDGRMWMTFGSFWTGIKLVELDPATGLRKPGAPVHPLAWATEIEAPCIISHAGSYFLFVNWGRCCRGIHSTYNIRVGRGAAITGPYLDKSGVDMMKAGGTLFLGSEGNRIGPGQAAVLRDGSTDWLSYHFYNAYNHGIPTLGLCKLSWGSDGWPVPGSDATNLIRLLPGP